MNQAETQKLSVTKESLQTALIQLLANKPLQDISITELSQRAGVSRMAYYRNYDSIVDLYQDTINGLLNNFLQNSQIYLQHGRWYDFWLALFQYLYSIKNEVKIILNTNQQIEVLHYLNRLFVPEDCPLPIETQLEIKGIIGLTFNIMITWVQADLMPNPEQLAQICHELLNQKATTFDPEYIATLSALNPIK